jgi:NADH-quinone oxidoreductase subunit L
MLTILVIAVLSLPLLNFAVWFFLPRQYYANCGYCATAVLAANVLLSVFLWQYVWHTTQEMPFIWFKISEQLGIYTYVYLDRLSAGIIFLANFIGFLVQLYAIFYLQGDRRYHRFFGLLGLFITAMQVLVLTDNLLIIYVAWEVVGLCSYLLISFWYEKPAAVQAAQKAFLLNRAGDIGFLLGIGLFIKLGVTTSLSWQSLHNASAATQESFVFVAGLVGILIACLAKSAQLPFSTWLPDAMQAPTPVSALLHAATMVVAGVYLAVRISPMFPPYLLEAVAVIGSISALVAAVQASIETQPKRILAYSTISQLGLLFVAVGTQQPAVVFFHLCTHAFFKANLFLTVGVLIKENTRPALAQLTFLAYLVSAASLAGLPFTSGFLSKEAVLMAYLSAPTHHFIIMALVTLTNCLTVYYILRQAYLLALPYRFEWKKFSWNYTQFDNADKTYLFIFGILAMLSLWLPFAFSPFDTLHSVWVGELATTFAPVHSTALGLSVMAWCVGGGLAYWHLILRKGKAPFWLYKLLTTNYLQLFYEWIWKNVFIKNSVRLKNSNNDFANSVAWVDGQFSQWFDKYVIDKIVETFTVVVVVFGALAAWFDKHTIDGGINGMAWLTGSLGNKSRTLQRGNIQAYIVGVVVWVLCLAVVCALLLFYRK